MGYGKCHECVKFGTMECPTSSMCLAFDERPYFVPKHTKKEPMYIDEDLKLVFAGLVTSAIFGAFVAFTKIVLGW